MSTAGSIALDTSAVVAHLRGVATVTARMQACLDSGETLYLPLTAWGELLYGVCRSNQPSRELANLAEFAKSVVLLYPTDKTAEAYAKIKHALASTGALIPENDLWIASAAMEHNLALAARDEHFGRIANLSVLDWR